MDRTHRRATTVATLVLAAGVAASLAGNLQAIHLDNRNPGVGAHVSATIWPIFLFASIEILLHTPWMANWRDRLTKGVAVGLVGAVAAYVSYFHLAHVLSDYGYDAVSRYAGPLAIDACMAMATLALNRVGHAREVVSKVEDMDTDTEVPDMDTEAPDMDMDNVQPARFTYTGPTAQWAELSRVPALDTNWTPEDVDWLSRLGHELDSTTTPAVPVASTPLPQRRGPRGTVDEVQALEWAEIARTHGFKAGEIAETLADHYGVSTRTIRRIPGWAEVAGRG
jgi:hypothetical protein